MEKELVSLYQNYFWYESRGKARNCIIEDWNSDPRTSETVRPSAISGLITAFGTEMALSEHKVSSSRTLLILSKHGAHHLHYLDSGHIC